jgi:type II secretory pathway component PulK
MTGICYHVLPQGKFVSWIKAGTAIGIIMTAVVATMILAVSNSAQSAQAKIYRADRSELRAVERHLPWGGLHSALLL